MNDRIKKFCADHPALVTVTALVATALAVALVDSEIKLKSAQTQLNLEACEDRKVQRQINQDHHHRVRIAWEEADMRELEAMELAETERLEKAV